MLELIKDGATCGETAAELNREFHRCRTERSIRHRCDQLGVDVDPNHVIDPALRARTMALLEGGKICLEIARITGRHQTSVLRMVHRLVDLGLLERTGGSTRTVRYRPTLKWLRNESDD